MFVAELSNAEDVHLALAISNSQVHFDMDDSIMISSFFWAGFLYIPDPF